MSSYTYNPDLYYLNYEYEVGKHKETTINKYMFFIYKYIFIHPHKDNVIYKYTKEVKKFNEEYYN